MKPKTITRLKRLAIGMLAMTMTVMQPAGALPDSSPLNTVVTAEAATAKKTPGKVTLRTIKAAAYNKITISWKKTTNATNYVIYYRKNGTSKWTKLTTVSSSKASYTHTSSKKYPIVVGQKYNYTVRAYNKISKKYGSYNAKGLTVKTLPATVKLKKAALNSKKTAITVSWNKASGANYYYVYRKTGTTSWKKIAAVKSSVLSYTDKSPVKGAKNTYTVRAYYSKTKALGSYNKTGVSATMPAVKVTKVALNKTSASLTKKGQTLQLTATVTPSKATNKAVTWKSSNTSVATVTSAGKVTAVSNGTATITATAADGSGKSATCKITVSISPSVVNVTGVTLDASLLDFRIKGETTQVHASITPSNASNKEVTWTSSDNSVATVSSTGTITAVETGTCTITATTTDGGKKASCQVTVTLPVGKIHSIKLSDDSLALTAKGQSKYVISYVEKDDTIDTALTWSSSNNSIATVNNSGKVTAVSSGVCTITCASYYDSSVNATCTVYVELLEGTHETKTTVQGVTFDMTHFPKMITVGDRMKCLSVIPESNINPADITYKIANGNAQLLCNSSTPNLYLSGTEQYVSEYYVSDWKNMMAYLSVSYDPGMYLQYRVEIYRQLQTGSFPVSVYYKGTLISTCKVIIASTYDKAVEYRKWMDDLEKKAWTSNMTAQEKLLAIKDYIYDNYSYTTDGYWCNDGAQALLYAARDLGLNARYRFVGSSYDYQKGIGDVYYHFGSAFCGGHVCTIVTIDNENYIIETQGHPG